ncbi:MAG: uroporphyrinogen-III synthase [Proteobacteria bacterium]|nr:uroporphyrinogen-III synthase [Pseudomonadota bacterium]
MTQRPGVLITRAAAEAKAMADAVQGMGAKVLFEPVLTIEPLDDASLDLSGVQAIAFTSANGVRAFVRSSAVRELEVFAVGEVTAAACRAANFAAVRNADGDALELALLIQQALDPRAGAILHPSGADVAGDLAGDLAAAGFIYRRAIVYRAVAALSLSAATARAFRSGAIAVAVFFSPRGAAIFARLALEQGLQPALSSVVAVCLSAAVRSSVAHLEWAEIVIADEPTPGALLGCLKNAIAAIP